MTKGKPLSKRLTALSLSRNLTQRQEHQLIAMADRVRHMEADLAELRQAPTVEQIVDVICASDPEHGGHEAGQHDHSHDPNAGECYWAYNVGPKIAALWSPQQRVTLDVLPPITRVPPHRRDVQMTMHLAASWERRRGHTGETNPYLEEL